MDARKWIEYRRRRGEFLRRHPAKPLTPEQQADLKRIWPALRWIIKRNRNG